MIREGRCRGQGRLCVYVCTWGWCRPLIGCHPASLSQGHVSYGRRVITTTSKPQESNSDQNKIPRIITPCQWRAQRGGKGFVVALFLEFLARVPNFKLRVVFVMTNPHDAAIKEVVKF
ncbi:hypothetical protein Zmor_021504 [Zophobas morio]|uniref:Uncharacterized protein n=1 Tax=Zophobas morio TaxID=2755281 RepID=A0AA38I7Y5_9CUCU|nr:hypothetical protein Zmor_021504 [Zophobas morio]